MKNNLILSDFISPLPMLTKRSFPLKWRKYSNTRKKLFEPASNWRDPQNLHPTKMNSWLKGSLELKGTTITISSASDNIFKSIDDLVEKLDRGLRRRSRLKRLNADNQLYGNYPPPRKRRPVDLIKKLTSIGVSFFLCILR